MEDAVLLPAFVAGILAFTFIGFISPIRIKLFYLRKDKEKLCRVQLIWLWNSVSLPVPLVLLRLFRQKGRRAGGAGGINFFSPAGAKFVFRYLKQRLARFRGLEYKLARHSYWRRMTVTLRFGMDEPLSVGIVSGILWVIAGNMLAILQRSFIFAPTVRPVVNICPDFSRTGFQMVVDLDVEYRQTFRLIGLALRSLRTILPTGGEVKEWRAIRSRG